MGSMLHKLFFIVLIKVLLTNKLASSTKDPLVAFLCGRPTKVLINDSWIIDDKQDCVKTAQEVVDFCKKSFPHLNIRTAEPAVQKVKFDHWCDFNHENCDIHLEIRPFKCLDKNFQSDALILPRNCQFGHLLNQGECANYKILAQRAREECDKKGEWILKSYGMLFPCGNNEKIIKAMHFKGVEFVCCPKDDQKNADETDMNIYKNYLQNGIFETEEGEQKNYEDSEKRLLMIETDKKSKVIEDFKNGERNIEPFWKSDPNNAKEKEKKLINEFKVVYNAIDDQFLNNKNQLLIFHSDRLEFIFNTKIKAAQHHLDELLNKPVKSAKEISTAMESFLILLTGRRKSLLILHEEAMRIHSNVIDNLDEKIQTVNKQINELFDKLNQVPELKAIIKPKLMNYLTNTNSDQSKSTENNKSIYDNEGRENLQDIIAKYKHRPEDPKKEDSIQVHYDLGLNDADQLGHFGQGHPNKINERETVYKRSLLGISFGVLIGMVFVLLIGVGYILYQRKRRLNGYSRPDLRNDDHMKVVRGFGVYDFQNLSKKGKSNGYENFNYITTSRLGNPEPEALEDTVNSEENPEFKKFNDP